MGNKCNSWGWSGILTFNLTKQGQFVMKFSKVQDNFIICVASCIVFHNISPPFYYFNMNNFGHY